MLSTVNLLLNSLAARNSAVSSWVMSDKPENWIRNRTCFSRIISIHQKEESIWLVLFPSRKDCACCIDMIRGKQGISYAYDKWCYRNKEIIK